MSPQQAGTLIDRLVAAFDKNLKPDTAAVYVEHLTRMPYEKTRLAVEACIEKERFFPSIGTIQRYANEATFEGMPGAEAYLQDGDTRPWHRRPEAEYMLWRQTQIESWRFPIPAPGEPAVADASDPKVAETRYWAYVYDKDDYRRRCNEAWRREWSQREDAA